MKWYTRRNLHIDRTASAWLIRKCIDPQAEFAFVSPDTDPTTLDGPSFDLLGGTYSHSDGKCTFQVMLDRYVLTDDLALVEMGRIILDADVPPRRTRYPEAAGLSALLRGFQLTTSDDLEKLRLTAPLYDALYAYCQTKVATKLPSRGTPRPSLNYRRRVAAHLSEDD